MSNPKYIYLIIDKVVKKARVSYDHPAYGFYQIYIPCGDEPGYESVYAFPIRTIGVYIWVYWWQIFLLTLVIVPVICSCVKYGIGFIK